MIKIRYADLPQGRHAHVRTCGRQPVIYLLPGLTPAQRRDALRRLIRTSRQGYGPRLRAAGVGCAVARDSAKSTARNAMAAVRCHPAGSAALAAFVAAAVVCYALFVTVTVRLRPGPSGPPAVAGAAPSRPQDAGGPGRSPGGRAGAPAGTQPAVAGKHGTSPAASAAGPGAGSPGPGASGTGSSGTGRSAGGPSGPGRPSPGPVPTGTWSAPGGVLPSTPAGRPPSSSPRPDPSPAPSPARGASPPGQPGGLCLQVGPLGICVSG
ncbi:MAG TPA: hypothetical protein VIF35_22320 [Streptosporangiaceae bacterium]